MPIILQKYVKGIEYNVIGLGDGKGNRIARPCRYVSGTSPTKARPGAGSQ
ncbi:MAG: hypothetical protein MZV63_27195 [Marinilabiliales bacterium]|nr:hypothetical protein [Marinilabiliales bacterium]